MTLFDAALTTAHRWIRVGDAYEVTRKPRGLDIAMLPKVPFAPMEAIPQGGAFAPDYTLREPQEIRSGTYFERGDLLIAKITPSFENGKQALTTELPAEFGFATTEVIPLRPLQEGHDSRLLFFYLLHPDIRQYVAERMEGTTGRQRIPEGVLLDLPFPEFGMEEQASIADYLQMILQLDAVEDAAIAVAQALKRAAMRTLFTRGLRGEAQKETEVGPVPESWEVVSVGDVYGITQGLSLKGNLAMDGSGVPFLRTSNVLWGRTDLNEISRMNLQGAPGPERHLRPGDLLVCEGGDVGRAAVWQGEIEPCLFQNHLHCLRPVAPDRTDARFAAAWFEEGFVHRSAYEGAGNRTTIPNLSRGRLAALSIPHPPRAVQSEIADSLDAIDRKIDLHRRKRSVLEELFRALLHRLMTGELRVGELGLGGQ